jgi:hypothetical protein
LFTEVSSKGKLSGSEDHHQNPHPKEKGKRTGAVKRYVLVPEIPVLAREIPERAREIPERAQLIL